MKGIFLFPRVLVLASLLFCVPVGVLAAPASLIEKIGAELGADAAFSDDERRAYLQEFRNQLAGYAFDILRDAEIDAADVLMRIVTEGSFDDVPLRRTVEIATAAYTAIRRGSSPEVVEGIALYGFARQLSADRIETWANGYNDCVKNGVPDYIAEDLVYVAAREEWDSHTFKAMKWGLVDAAKAGYSMEDFHIYLFGNYLTGRLRAGATVSDAMSYFRKLRSEGLSPELPAYEGSFIPRKMKKEVPPPAAQGRLSPDGKEKETPKHEAPHRMEQAVSGEKDTESRNKEGRGGGFLSRILSGLERAMRSFLGVPYVWGGETRMGTDCSGFVRTVFQEIGIQLPRTSRQQWSAGRAVAEQDLKKGDLVFFRTSGRRVSHVGIMSDPSRNEFMHASSSKGVVAANLEYRYFRNRYAGARRVLRE